MNPQQSGRIGGKEDDKVHQKGWPAGKEPESMSCGQAALVTLEYVGRMNERVGTIENTTALIAKDQSLKSGKRILSGSKLSLSILVLVNRGRPRQNKQFHCRGLWVVEELDKPRAKEQ